MRPIDLLTFPLVALWQQKLRTVLTMLGVVFGAFVLAASLSIGVGVRETIDRESHRSDISRRIEISPKWNTIKAETVDVTVEGTLSEARRGRIGKTLAEMKQRANPAQVPAEITRDRLTKIAELPHVDRLVPLVYHYGFAMLGQKAEGVQILSARPEDETIRRRIVAGRSFEAKDRREVIVSEFLAYRLGLTTDEQIDGLVGMPLRIEFRAPVINTGLNVYLMKSRADVSREERTALDKITARLPASLEKLGLTTSEAEALRKAAKAVPATVPAVSTEEFTVVGVIRAPKADDPKGPPDRLNVDADVFLPYETASDVFFRGPGDKGRGVQMAVATVDTEANVKDVLASILATGVHARAAIEFIERERFIYTMIFGAMTCVAAVALLVSALGIANTMLMSVLERTREIGIMKAVGADNSHLQFIFLMEGGLIGLLGAVIGLLMAWAASFPGDAWVQSMVLRDIKIDLKGSIFAFPPWLALTVLVFTVVVTTLSAVYPARRAARIDPVSALRHE